MEPSAVSSHQRCLVSLRWHSIWFHSTEEQTVVWHASPDLDPDSDGNCDWHVKIRANSDWVPLFKSSTDSDLLYACSSTGGSSSEILNTNAVVNDYSPHKLEST
jgi:hypothetical protein